MKTSPWTMARASCQGSKNRARQQTCQDHAQWAAMPRFGQQPDTMVAALADGMGSAKHSGPAACIAVHAALRDMTRLLWREQQTDPQLLETILNSAALQARLSVQRLARSQDEDLLHYATTLLLLIHTGKYTATLQIGDGAAVVRTANELVTLAKPQRGEYANETNSLTGRGALQLADVSIVQPQQAITGFAMMTDGMMELSIDSATLKPYAPFFKALFGWLEEHDGTEHPNRELKQTLASEAVTSRTDDDTTLLLAIRQEAP